MPGCVSQECRPLHADAVRCLRVIVLVLKALVPQSRSNICFIRVCLIMCMRYVPTRIAPLAMVLMLSGAAFNVAQAQEHTPHVDIEVEPAAYLFDGAGGTLSYQPGIWRYSLEIFSLSVPTALHGHDAFENNLLGAELHAERFLGSSTAGFFVGPEVGVSRLEVTHQTSGVSNSQVQYSVGVRGGYRFYLGLGDLYISPQGGLVYALNGSAIEIAGDTFETGPVTPFVTVGLGWSF